MKALLKSNVHLWEFLRSIQLAWYMHLTRRRISRQEFPDQETKELFQGLCGRSLDVEIAGRNPLVARIETRRREFLGCRDILKPEDNSPDPYCGNLKVREATCASKPSRLAAVLYLLIEWRQPRTVIEFGTNLGISAAWQAAAMRDIGGAVLHTFEISPSRIQFARQWLQSEGFDNIAFHNMDFDDAVREVIPALEPVDFAFIDGNHNLEATTRYFGILKGIASGGAVFVFDDIRWSAGMREAWSVIVGQGGYRIAIEYAGMGIVILK